jgi:hypothetical protein
MHNTMNFILSFVVFTWSNFVLISHWMEFKMDFMSKMVILHTKYSTFREEKLHSDPRHAEINDTALY